MLKVEVIFRDKPSEFYKFKSHLELLEWQISQTNEFLESVESFEIYPDNHKTIETEIN